MCVDIAEDSNFLVKLVFLDFDHLPTEEDVNAALVALVEGDFISVWELVDFLIRRVELETSTGGCSHVHLVHSEERLVVERVEVRAFALVGELG